MTSPAAQWGPRSSLDRVKNALADAIDKDRGDTFTARCPCHDDSTASLSVTWRAGDASRGGLVLLNCHGCSASALDIAEAVDLSPTDLWDDPPPKRSSQDASERIGRSAQARRAGQRRSKQGRLPAQLISTPKAPCQLDAGGVHTRNASGLAEDYEQLAREILQRLSEIDREAA